MKIQRKNTSLMFKGLPKKFYDHCRRVLYKHGCDPIQTIPTRFQLEDRPHTCDVQAAQLQEQLTKMEDSFKCKICMDTQIDTVFLPCGHMVFLQCLCGKC
ncbi:Zinc ion binding [Desmophyllum pertusum]|uniref:Zinc ion binding n=1 Tax=Desmophyllum pertusum TaxID=174260 RepID=A0A9W9Z420_9CNID|nr:Zinc ion binding [Desmophyllum pertusum]